MRSDSEARALLRQVSLRVQCVPGGVICTATNVQYGDRGTHPRAPVKCVAPDPDTGYDRMVSLLLSCFAADQVSLMSERREATALEQLAEEVESGRD